MESKKWWACRKTITRKELIIYGWLCSIPIIGWLNLIVTMLKKKTDISITGWNQDNPVVPKNDTGVNNNVR